MREYKLGDRVRYELFEAGGKPLGVVDEAITRAEDRSGAFESSHDDPRWKKCGWFRVIGGPR